MASSPTAFTCDPRNFVLTQAMKQSFDDNGYVLIRGFLDDEEVGNVRKSLEGSDLFSSKFWSLLGGEVYHYHAKLLAKQPGGVGGKFVWHQDYGYWYKNGCLYPDMLSVFIPIDPCHRENGCLQMLEGSHKCGRIDHDFKASQQGCDEERLKQIKANLPLLYMEMDPGDVVFFHSNVLHCSGVNSSSTKRWVVVPCYNKASNNPVYKHHCPQYTPLSKVPDIELRECKNYTDLSGKDFMNPSTDNTIRVADN